MISKTFAQKFTADWVDSWNTHDLDRILSHYAEGFEIESPLALKRFPESKGVLKGKAAIRKYWGLGLQLNPQLTFEIIEVLVGVNSLSIYYRSVAAEKNVMEMFIFGKEGKVVKTIVCYNS